MKKSLKITLSVIAAVLVAAIIIVSVLFIEPYFRRDKIRENFDVKDVSTMSDNGGDYIRFLNTVNSDAILLESNGHFALIDSGEDTDNPRGLKGLELEGYEDRVLEYLKKHAVGEDGKVHLDFVVGTHSHSDHIGGFDTIISDPDVIVEKAYLKKYDSSNIMKKEIKGWDNQEVYDQMVNALNNRGVEIISDIPSEPFKFGDFTITFLNTEDNVPKYRRVGENDQSIGTLVEKNGKRAFLAGDIDNITGDEKRLAPQIGDVDILKVGHHGNTQSTSIPWLRTLKPEVCVVTNKSSYAHDYTLCTITRVAKSAILLTGDENGVVAQFGDDGEIHYYNNLHEGIPVGKK